MKKTITKIISFVVIVTSGILLGYCIGQFRTADEIDVIKPIDTLMQEFINSSDPEIRNFAMHLNDPVRKITLSPLLIEVYEDQKRFTIQHKQLSYIIASEQYYFIPENQKVMTRTYFFKENNVDMYLAITRDIETNKIIEIMYSFSNNNDNKKKIYIDKNGDGTWDDSKK